MVMRGGSLPRYQHILNIYLWLVYNLISRSWPQIQTGVLWAPTLALRAGLPDLWLLAFGLSGYHHDWLTLPSSLIKHIRDNHLWFKSPVPLLHRPDWDDDSASNSQDLKSWKWKLNMPKEVNESWKCQLAGCEKSSHDQMIRKLSELLMKSYNSSLQDLKKVPMIIRQETNWAVDESWKFQLEWSETFWTAEVRTKWLSFLPTRRIWKRFPWSHGGKLSAQ